MGLPMLRQVYGTSAFSIIRDRRLLVGLSIPTKSLVASLEGGRQSHEAIRVGTLSAADAPRRRFEAGVARSRRMPRSGGPGAHAHVIGGSGSAAPRRVSAAL